MKIAFILSMPRRGSWNGDWSGSNRCYCRTREVPKKRRDEILSKRNYFFCWDDGWSACVTCKPCAEARKEIRNSDGFCGYDWMIDSIIAQNEIIAISEGAEKDGYDIKKKDC